MGSRENSGENSWLIDFLTVSGIQTGIQACGSQGHCGLSIPRTRTRGLISATCCSCRQSSCLSWSWSTYVRLIESLLGLNQWNPFLLFLIKRTLVDAHYSVAPVPFNFPKERKMPSWFVKVACETMYNSKNVQAHNGILCVASQAHVCSVHGNPRECGCHGCLLTQWTFMSKSECLAGKRKRPKKRHRGDWTVTMLPNF